jgi:segregation and condensation protein B
MFWKPKSPAPQPADASTERPFQVVTPTSQDDTSQSASEDNDLLTDSTDALSTDDIEAAYLRALEAAEAAESWQPPEEISIALGSDSTEENPLAPDPAFTIPAASRSSAEVISVDTEPDPAIEAQQVVEALLFVGGQPMPAKRLLDVLGGRFSQEQLDELLDSLARRYAVQQRPYQLLLGEGGYSLQLREEFEPIRGRVYGHGPKEVKLAQDALEILAIIAYQQPITRQQIEETERANIPANLRQLLRRQLVSLERSATDNSQVYRTTARFLELFGLASLSDLPQAMDFNFK